LLLCLGLVGKDADTKALAVDALIEAIDGKRFDIDIFTKTIADLCKGEWVKYNRLADSLTPVLQASLHHALVVYYVLQKLIPYIDLQQKSAFRLLEVFTEAKATAGQPLEGATKLALEGLRGNSKAVKIVHKLLLQR
jgi:Family of unknown function (DUF6493)